MAAELGQQTVEFSDLVRRAAEDSYLALKELVDKSKSDGAGAGGEQPTDSEKKIGLLKFIVRTRQRMLRLHVLAKWCLQVPLVHYCQQLASTLSSHETCFTQTADSLYFMHEGLQQARAPIFDVPSAIEVFLTGGYRRLPKSVEDIGAQSTLLENEQKPALTKLNTLVQSKLLEMTLPKEISKLTVSDGVAVLHVEGEFKVLITLGYRGHLSLWRILHLELLLGEGRGPIKLEESRRYALGEDLERRMAVVENPFMTLYTILHEFCVALVMDTVIRQAQVLRQSRWKDAMKFELLTDSHSVQSGNNAVSLLGQEGELDSTGLRIPGLKITYWSDLRKSNAANTESSPFIKIEPGQDLKIRCLHSKFLLDPLTDKEAILSLDQKCINVEKLLLRAISCNIHTRLLEIQRELSTNFQICQSSDDVIRKHKGDENETSTSEKGKELSFILFQKDEVLQVKAYGQSYFTLGVNIRNGQFILQSSKNVVPASVLSECEDSLNKGNISASEIFLNLRCKSILHLLSSIGRFLGLKVYDGTFDLMKIPSTILKGPNLLLMGFPQCRKSYYLLVQLDVDFKPFFHLLETQPYPGEGNNINGDAKNVVRWKAIDIEQMCLNSDELTMSLFDYEKLHLVQNGLHNQISESRLPENHGLEPIQQLSSQTSFGSIVDSVFECNSNSSRSFPTKNQLHTAGVDSYGREGISQHHQTTNVAKISSGSMSLGIYKSNNANVLQSLVRSPPLADVTSDHHKLVESSSQSTLVGCSAGTPDSTKPTLCEKKLKKRTFSELIQHIHSLKGLTSDNGQRKRRKVSDDSKTCSSSLETGSFSTMGRNNSITCGNLLADGNCGSTANVYASVLILVMRHCSLCIKHAQLTSQMDALGIPYVEEAGSQIPSSNLWLRLPFARDDCWKRICLHLGKAGSMHWEVKINDSYFKELWELQGGSSTTPWGSNIRLANTSESDSYISFDSTGVTLTYKTVEADSIEKLVSDLHRLSNSLVFARGMRILTGIKVDDKPEENQNNSETKSHTASRGTHDAIDRLSEQVRKAFKVEAVGLMSLWFSYGSMQVVHFVVEWEARKEGCTMHVSPDQLWPHTKFLEDFVNRGEVASFLDCIRLTTGPLLALSGAVRPARMPVTVSPSYNPPKQMSSIHPQGLLASGSTLNVTPAAPPAPGNAPIAQLANPPLHASTMLPVTGRIGPGLVPSSLLPSDVSVVLRGPYWIRIFYRKKFSVDMRCFAGDQVWLQPATPPKGGPLAGGSLPCPQFRPFIMENVAQGLNALDSSFVTASHAGTTNIPGAPSLLSNSGRQNMASAMSLVRPSIGSASQIPGSSIRAANAMLASSALTSGISGIVRLSPGTTLPLQMKGELNTAFIGLGDDGGYGGGWVPIAALKKVLRGILKYLGVLWLFSQLPDLLREILGSILKDNEGALLNLDQEQPALRFFVGGYVFAVSVHRVQLLMQVLSVRRFHHQQQQQQQQQQQHAQNNAQEELAQAEINEICDYFTRRVASEPYDASRVASFITLLTLPISALREFLKLIAWKKGFLQAHGDIATAQRARVELGLENHSGSLMDDGSESSQARSNIHHNRAQNSVDFSLVFVLDHAHIPHVSVAGGAAWLPHCISVRLRYSFGESSHISFLDMDGSHGGKACWLQPDEWVRCKQRVARAVEVANGTLVGDASQGRLRLVTETMQKTLQGSLQQMQDGPLSAGSTAS